jgi:hypothetical protein
LSYAILVGLPQNDRYETGGVWDGFRQKTDVTAVRFGARGDIKFSGKESLEITPRWIDRIYLPLDYRILL